MFLLPIDILELHCSKRYAFSGIPGMPVFVPNVTEIEPSKFLLEWTTPSFSNILEHRLIYKQVKVIFHSNK